MAITTVSQHVVSVNAIQGTLIADNAITAVHIATNAVSGTLIADNAITATHIAQNVITVTQLADDAVEAAKIADGVITTNHLNKAMISSQTEVTAATGDFLLIGDTSDSNNLKKVPVSSILAGTLTTAAQTNITSVGTLTALTGGTGDFNWDSGTLFVDSSANAVGIGETTPDAPLHITSNTPIIVFDESDASQEYRIGSFGGSFAIYDSTDSAYRLVVDGDGHAVVGGTTVDAAGTVSLKSDGNIRAVGASSTAYDTLIGAISGVSNGFHIVQDTSDNQTYNFYTGSQQALTIDGSGIVINESSADKDFRIESDGSTHMFFVDAGNNKILMSSGPASDTQSTPHDTLTLAVAYSDSAGTNGAAGLGPRLAFKIPDDEDNPSLGGGIAVVKESADDSVSNAAMTFATSQNDETLDEYMRITSSGDLLSNTTTAVGSFYNGVSGIGFGYSSGGYGCFVRAGTAQPLYVSTNSQGSGGFIEFSQNGASRGTITYDGSNMVYGGTSDYRLKKNVTPIENALTKILALNPINFDWIESGAKHDGFLAQEAQTVVPYAVTGVKDEVATDENSPEEKANGEPLYQMMEYGKLTPLLVKAIQELEARIKTLEG